MVLKRLEGGSPDASTAGWGFAQFDDGKPAGEAVHSKCFACHEIVKARDFVFNRYAP
jgi:cytochrome c2